MWLALVTSRTWNAHFAGIDALEEKGQSSYVEVCVSASRGTKAMEHPTPSDFIVEVEEGHVSVTFKPTDSSYSFGRLADPEDIARHGPLSLRKTRRR